VTFVILLLLPLVLLIRWCFGIWPYNYRWTLVFFILLAGYTFAEFLLNAIYGFQNSDHVSIWFWLFVACLIPLPLAFSHMAFKQVKGQKETKGTYVALYITLAIYSLPFSIEWYPWGLLFLLFFLLAGVGLFQQWDKFETRLQKKD
jgi:hypothetical protein